MKGHGLLLGIGEQAGGHKAEENGGWLMYGPGQARALGCKDVMRCGYGGGAEEWMGARARMAHEAAGRLVLEWSHHARTRRPRLARNKQGDTACRDMDSG